VSTEDLEGSEIEKQAADDLKKISTRSASIWALPKLFAKGRGKSDKGIPGQG
jgi:hypothetical protein